MKYVPRFFILIILVALISGCSGNSNILFSDDFSNTNTKWDQTGDASMSTNYDNGAYRIQVNVANYDAWSNPDTLTFTDVQIEVDATKNAGPDTNDFGVICRYIDQDKYYYGIISSDGFYGIYKKTAEGGYQLGQGGEQSSDKILQGAATNHIRFDCVGSTFTLYVNGQQIDQRSDSSYKEGNVGLIAGTYTETGVDISFDNLFVYKPPAQ